MVKIPFIVSIPHGGHEVPPYLQRSFNLTKEEILLDGDIYTREIYSSTEIEAVVSQKIARAVIDMNRHEETLGPTYPDGIIKSKSCQDKNVYIDFPDPFMINRLIKDYFQPYHIKIQKLTQEKGMLLGLDCHSMLPHSPVRDHMRNEERPYINLGNNFGHSCDNKLIHLLSFIMQREFQIPRSQIQINTPFSGGFITSSYGNNPIPWIQIELNRSLYWGETPILFNSDVSIKKRIKRMNCSMNNIYKNLYRML